LELSASLLVTPGSTEIGAVIDPEGVSGLGAATINSPVKSLILFSSRSISYLFGTWLGLTLFIHPQTVESMPLSFVGVSINKLILLIDYLLLLSGPEVTLLILTTTLLSPLFYCCFT
jgi:hypothetical protein